MEHIAWWVPEEGIVSVLAGTTYNMTAQEIAEDEGNAFYITKDTNGVDVLAHENIWATMPNAIVDGVPVPKASFVPPSFPFPPF